MPAAASRPTQHAIWCLLSPRTCLDVENQCFCCISRCVLSSSLLRKSSLWTRLLRRNVLRQGYREWQAGRRASPAILFCPFAFCCQHHLHLLACGMPACLGCGGAAGCCCFLQQGMLQNCSTGSLCQGKESGAPPTFCACHQNSKSPPSAS